MYKGKLKYISYVFLSVIAKVCLTVKLTNYTGT